MKSNNNGSIGFAGLLALLFIALKLTHVIDWSWWWVLSPLWISAGLVLVIFILVPLIIAAFVFGASAIDGIVLRAKYRREKEVRGR